MSFSNLSTLETVFKSYRFWSFSCRCKVKTQRKVYGFDENDMKTCSFKRGLRLSTGFSERASKFDVSFMQLHFSITVSCMADISRTRTRLWLYCAIYRLRFCSNLLIRVWTLSISYVMSYVMNSNESARQIAPSKTSLNNTNVASFGLCLVIKASRDLNYIHSISKVKLENVPCTPVVMRWRFLSISTTPANRASSTWISNYSLENCIE